MRAIDTIKGNVSVLERDDVDTDQIIPKQFLKRVERTGFGQYLFYDWAKQPGWELAPNPILLAGANFGCGSSREHAPWALQDYGFQAIIAPSFADIFRSNCMKIGLLPVELSPDECAAVARACGPLGIQPRQHGPRPSHPAAGEAEVDLDAQEVRWTGGSAAFEIDSEIKHRLLNGLDDVALTLAQDGEISAYERDRERVGPITTAL
ncbi:MAG: 3-isopropylmalate dehydratase small subunit [Actinomycetota bacterium]|nr:3-isopropylmalate dehydratase small subunit [Actinomycetota bacterium]